MNYTSRKPIHNQRRGPFYKIILPAIDMIKMQRWKKKTHSASSSELIHLDTVDQWLHPSESGKTGPGAFQGQHSPPLSRSVLPESMTLEPDVGNRRQGRSCIVMTVKEPAGTAPPLREFSGEEGGQGIISLTIFRRHTKNVSCPVSKTKALCIRMHT